MRLCCSYSTPPPLSLCLFTTHNLVILLDWVPIRFNLCPLCFPLLPCLLSFLPLLLVPPLPDSLRISTWHCYSRYFLSHCAFVFLQLPLCLMFPCLLCLVLFSVSLDVITTFSLTQVVFLCVCLCPRLG